MDISKWLNETVLPQQPPSPHNQRVHCHTSHRERTGRFVSEKHKRKQPSSDSSLLQDPLQLNEKIVLLERGVAINENANRSAHTDASHPTVRSGSSISTGPYRRKPRRKTRPERYEPVAHNAEERGTHTRINQRSEPRRTRRASRRNKADKSSTGTVQNFQAHNVPRTRLTLKPRKKLGLFSKGRVSSPVKVRGLPDLVFSEMKFLQKNKDQPEADLQVGSWRKKGKKDHACTKEEDISAYFTSVQPRLAEQDSNIQATETSRQTLRDSERAQRDCSPIIDHSVPTVDNADEAPRSKARRSEAFDKTESYVSWSESILAPSVTPAQLRFGTVRDAGRLDSGPSSQKVGNGDGEGLLHLRLAPLPVTKRCGREERFQVSSLPPTNERVSRSHSLPQQASSPRHVNLVDRGKRHRTGDAIASPSSIPLEVMTNGDARCEYNHQLHVADESEMRDDPAEIQFPNFLRHQYNGVKHQTEQCAQEKAERQRSSSLGRVLQDCNAVFHGPRKYEALPPLARRSPRAVSAQGAVELDSALYPAIRDLPTVRFSGFNEIHCPSVPITYGLNLYERQTQRQYEVPGLIIQPRDSLPPPYTAQDQYLDGEDSDRGETTWDDETDPQTYGGGPLAFREGSAKVWNDGFAQETRSGRKIAARPGFWRPHKLY